MWKIYPDSTIADRLEEIDHRDVIITREPGGTIREDIRHLLMHAILQKAFFRKLNYFYLPPAEHNLSAKHFSAIEEGKLFFVTGF